MLSLKAVWRSLKGQTPEKIAEARRAELSDLIVANIKSWPGVLEAYSDDRKIKAVIDDEGLGLVAFIKIDVRPVSLKHRKIQAERRAASAKVLADRANAAGSKNITGRLNIVVDADDVITARQGESS